MPRQAHSPLPFPEPRGTLLQQKGFNIVHSRKLKSCSVNTSHSKALAFQYTANPLTSTDPSKSSQDKAKT